MNDLPDPAGPAKNIALGEDIASLSMLSNLIMLCINIAGI